jgi:hypothetical protein
LLVEQVSEDQEQNSQKFIKKYHKSPLSTVILDPLHTHRHTHTHTHTHTHIQTHTHIYKHTHTHTHTIYIYILYVCVCVCVCVCVHKHTHTHTPISFRPNTCSCNYCARWGTFIRKTSYTVTSNPKMSCLSTGLSGRA